MKIYDTFPFDAELDLLEHRLRETFDLVDVIVLVEAAETYKGEPKGLHFRDHRERFAWAASKLRPIVLPRRSGQTPWARENFQRDAIVLGLLDADPEDLVLILDADEIPSRSLLQRLRSDGLKQPHRLTMTRHYGRFDWLAPRSTCCPSHLDPFPFAIPRIKPPHWDALTPEWHGNSGLVASVRDLRGDPASVLPPRSATDLRQAVFMPRIEDAGRHFNSVESVSDLQAKLSHLPHVEHATPRAVSQRHLLRARRYGLHHLGWWYAEPPGGPLPEDLVRFQRQAGDGCTVTTMPASVFRHAARSWFWLRMHKRLPEGLVQWVDEHFEAVLPVLLLPLLFADGIRRLCAAWQANSLAMRYQASQPVRNLHG